MTFPLLRRTCTTRYRPPPCRTFLGLEPVRQRPEAGYWLELGPERLELVTTGRHGAVSMPEFVEGAMRHRREQGGGRGQPVAKAIGLKGARVLPRVVDATAGLGGDSSALASLGCTVILLEPLAGGRRPRAYDALSAPVFIRTPWRSPHA